MADDIGAPTSTDIPEGVDPAAYDAVEQRVQQAQVEREQYEGHPIEAAAEGAARTLTFGLSDEALRGLGMSAARISKIKEYNAMPAGIGEAGGIIAPAIASGGESAIAQGIAGAGKGLEAVSAGGELLGGATQSFLKDKVRSAAVRDMLSTGTSMGAEGMAYSLGDLISEHAQDKADLNAQNMVAAAGAGAMLGGAFGTAFGALKASVPLVSKGITPITDKLNKLMDPEAAALHLVGADEKYLQEKVLPYQPTFKEDLPDYLTNKLNMRYDHPEELLTKNKAFLQSTGEQIGETVGKLDKAVVDMSPEQRYQVLGNRTTVYAPMIRSLDEEEARLAKLPRTNKGDIRTVREMRSDLVELAQKTEPLNFAELDDLRKRYQGIKFKGGGAAESFKANLANGLRGQLRQAVDSIATNVVSAGLGGASDLAQQLKGLNKDYAMASVLTRTLPKRLNAKQLLTMGDVISGGALGAGGVMGAAGALAHGALPIAALGVAAKKFANSDLRRHLAVLADLRGQRISATTRITEAVDAFVNSAKRPGKQLSLKALTNSGFAVNYSTGQVAKNNQQAYQNVLQNVSSLQTDPNLLVDRLAKSTGRVGSVSPAVAQEAQQTLVRALMFIAEKIPRDPSAGTNTIFEKHYQPSSIELAKMQRYIQAVEHPFTILEDLEKGTLTREHIEAVQAVYPAVYQQIRQQAIDRIAKDGQSMSYSKKVQAAILLDVPTDESLQPYAIRGLQASFQAQASAPNGAIKPSAGAASKIDASNRAATDTQQIESRKQRP